jgi:two-component system, response regulator RegA
MGKNVLLVEDDRVSRESLAYLLRGLGHTVYACWSAEEAKNAIHEFTPDIALLDVRLPGLPGDAFALYLHHRFPHVKIIFVSGEFRLDDPQRFGPEVDFIPKPVDFGRLLSAIQ